MPRRDFDTTTGVISSDSLCSPPEIVNSVYEILGDPIGCDPATNEHSIIRAKTAYTWGGLIKPWKERSYVNWPYSTNEPWADKAIREMKIGHVTELMILCMTATSTMWWQKTMLLPRRNPRVICTRRLAFLGPSGKPLKNGARFDTSLIYFGRHVRKFDKEFAHVARWTTWGR